MVCVAIYSVLVQNISVSTDISTAIWTCMGYTVLLCFCLFKTSSLAEQEKFRDWLKGQPPEEALNHAYEYTIREDILLSLEYHDLSDAQADALMKFPSPLADVFRDFEKRETDTWM